MTTGSLGSARTRRRPRVLRGPRIDSRVEVERAVGTASIRFLASALLGLAEVR